METITQKLQELTKSRRCPKLVYKQSVEKKASFFVKDT